MTHMCYLAFSYQYKHNFSFQSNRLLFSHVSAEVRKENTPENLRQPGIELTTTSARVRHAHHGATRAGRYIWVKDMSEADYKNNSSNFCTLNNSRFGLKQLLHSTQCKIWFKLCFRLITQFTPSICDASIQVTLS